MALGKWEAVKLGNYVNFKLKIFKGIKSRKWTMGEPFDHAKGKERCALLNINERRLDDVDCDLGSGAGFNYRFVCQRSHEKHIEVK